VIPCTSSQPQAIQSNLNNTVSSLSYNAVTDQYTYIWKTDKAWKKTCRRLVLGFADGTTHYADFEFN